MVRMFFSWNECTWINVRVVQAGTTNGLDMLNSGPERSSDGRFFDKKVLTNGLDKRDALGRSFLTDVFGPSSPKWEWEVPRVENRE